MTFRFNFFLIPGFHCGKTPHIDPTFYKNVIFAVNSQMFLKLKEL